MSERRADRPLPRLAPSFSAGASLLDADHHQHVSNRIMPVFRRQHQGTSPPQPRDNLSGSSDISAEARTSAVAHLDRCSEAIEVEHRRAQDAEKAEVGLRIAANLQERGERLGADAQERENREQAQRNERALTLEGQRQLQTLISRSGDCSRLSTDERLTELRGEVEGKFEALQAKGSAAKYRELKDARTSGSLDDYQIRHDEDLAAHDQQLIDHSKQLARNEQQISRHDGQLIGQSKQLATHMKRMAGHEDDMTNLRKAQQELTSRQRSQHDRFSDTSSRIAQLEGFTALQDDRLDNLTSNMSSQDERLNNLAAQIARQAALLDDCLKKITAQVTHHATSEDGHLDNIDPKMTQIDGQTSSQHDRLDARIAQLDDCTSSLQAQITTLNDTLAHVTADALGADGLAGQVERLQVTTGQNAANVTSGKDLLNRLARLDKTFSARLDDLSTSLVQLREQIMSQRNDIVQLNDALCHTASLTLHPTSGLARQVSEMQIAAGRHAAGLEELSDRIEGHVRQLRRDIGESLYL